MVARNMQYIVSQGKKYVGIDVVPQYIDMANEIVKNKNLIDICELLCINAENLDTVLQKSMLLKKFNKSLFFFPFNSFGNIDDYVATLNSMKNMKNVDFIIFSYITDEKATKERAKYYSNCDYNNLIVRHEDLGVRFVSDSGLNSMAYNEEFLVDCIKKMNMKVTTILFSKIGVAFFIKND